MIITSTTHKETEVQSKELIKELEAAGWVLKRIEESHHMFKHPTNPNTVAVPHPKKDLPRGTVRGIKKTAGLI
jgi:predicted RNA binding protein YcfA (HicA-like mRNA interferase family)